MIFISYRRSDSDGQALTLYKDLVAVFGVDNVFLDVTGMQKGKDFRTFIRDRLQSSNVFLALIGPSWLSASDDGGSRRIDNPNDLVRTEISAALSRDISVIPVLVRGARMPRELDLPEDLRSLVFRDGVELTHARWDADVKLLVEALRQQLPKYSRPAESAGRIIRWGAAVAASLLGLAILLQLSLAPVEQPPPQIVAKPAPSPPIIPPPSAQSASVQTPPTGAVSVVPLKAVPATLAISTEPGNARILIDGAPYQPNREYEAGSDVQVVASLPGYYPQTRRVLLKEGESRSVVLTLKACPKEDILEPVEVAGTCQRTRAARQETMIESTDRGSSRGIACQSAYDKYVARCERAGGVAVALPLSGDALRDCRHDCTGGSDCTAKYIQPCYFREGTTYSEACSKTEMRKVGERAVCR